MKQITETELIFHFAHLNQDLQQCVCDVIAIRQSEVEEFLIEEHNSRHNKLLQSFHWDVKYIMGTSSLAKMRQQLATLILNCRQSTGATETIFFEMKQEQVKHLINILEECQVKLKELNNDSESVVSEQIVK